jgi:hypothetical protein
MSFHINRENFDKTRRAETGAVAGATGAIIAFGSGASGAAEIALVTGLTALILGYGILLAVMLEWN